MILRQFRREGRGELDGFMGRQTTWTRLRKFVEIRDERFPASWKINFGSTIKRGCIVRGVRRRARIWIEFFFSEVCRINTTYLNTSHRTSRFYRRVFKNVPGGHDDPVDWIIRTYPFVVRTSRGKSLSTPSHCCWATLRFQSKAKVIFVSSRPTTSHGINVSARRTVFITGNFRKIPTKFRGWWIGGNYRTFIPNY